MEQAMREMPRYLCHKMVWALKIAEVVLQPANVHIIVPEDQDYAPFEVSDEYVKKHNPQPGGYYVAYEDGYKSYSPAKAFEDGYIDMRKGQQIRGALMEAINRHSMESGSDTPDFILAAFLADCLGAFDRAMQHRTKIGKPLPGDVTPIVTGALYDLMAWLTTRPQKLVLCATEEAGPAVEVLKEFFERRGIDTTAEPLIPDWKYQCKRTANSPMHILT